MTDEGGKDDADEKGCYIRAGGFGCAVLAVLVALAAYGLYRLVGR